MCSHGKKSMDINIPALCGDATWSFGFWKTNFHGVTGLCAQSGEPLEAGVGRLFLRSSSGTWWGPEGLSEPGQTCCSPALTHRRVQDSTSFLLPLSIMFWKTLTFFSFTCELEAMIFQFEKRN